MIVVNARFLTQPVTGVQRFAEQVCLELARQRDDLVLVAPKGRLRDLPGHEVRTIGTHSGHRWEQGDLPRWLRSQGSPLLLSLTSTAPAFYRPQIVTHHDITWVRHPESFSRPFRALYGMLVPRVLRAGAAIITVSEFSRSEIAGRFRVPESKFTVVPNAVDARFHPGAGSADPPYLLAVSSPNAHKNFERLVRAFAAYAPRSNSRLVIVGGTNRSFASVDLGDSSGRVEERGRVTDDELIALLQGARGFLFPSLYEGFGIPPLEAQACGVPVAAARAAVMPEVLGDSVLWFDPLDVDGMSAAIERLDTDSVLREDLVARGAQNVARYSWADSARRVSRLIDEVGATAAVR